MAGAIVIPTLLRSRSLPALLHAKIDDPLLSPWVPEDTIPTQEKSAPGKSAQETTWTLMTCLMGAGVIAMPKAASLGGSIGFIALMVLTTALMAFTMWVIGHLLGMVDSWAEVQDVKREDRGWNVIGRCAFGKFGEVLMSFVGMMDLSCVILSFMVIGGTHLKTTVALVVPGLADWVTTFLVGLVTLALVSSGSKLADLSFSGLMILLPPVCLLAITVYELSVTDQLATDHQQFVTHGLGPSFALLLYAFAAHGEAPYFYQAMEDRSKWGLSVAWAFAGTATLFGAVGLLGYYAFGESASDTYVVNLGRDTDLVVLRHPLPSSVNTWFPLVCSALVSMKMLLTLPVLVKPTMSFAKELFGISGHLWDAFFVVLFTVAACLFASRMALVLELCGIVADNLVCIIFPCLAFLRLVKKLPWPTRALLVAIIAIFTVYMIWGVWDALHRQ